MRQTAALFPAWRQAFRHHVKPPLYAGNKRPLHRRVHPNFPVHVIRFIQVVVFSIQYPKIVQLK